MEKSREEEEEEADRACCSFAVNASLELRPVQRAKERERAVPTHTKRLLRTYSAFFVQIQIWPSLK